MLLVGNKDTLLSTVADESLGDHVEDISVLVVNSGCMLVVLWKPEILLVLGRFGLEVVTTLSVLMVASILALESETLNTVDASTRDDGPVLCDTDVADVVSTKLCVASTLVNPGLAMVVNGCFLETLVISLIIDVVI